MSRKDEIVKKLQVIERKIDKENEIIQKSTVTIKSLNKEKELLMKENKNIEALEVLEILQENGIQINELKELLRYEKNNS